MSENKHNPSNFIERIIDEHNESGRFNKVVHTRFPPEPNGYLHIGHAKAICISFGIAQKYGGKTNLRFDDTNPVTEDTEFVEAIQKDVKWLGFDWEDRLFFASDYFDQFYENALKLIREGKAYVDHSSAETMDVEKRAGKNSVYRERSVEENLDWFEKMKSGELADGTCVLRAKIDMNADNWILRDPVLYRIKKATHHRTGDDWCIYPMYDFAHGYSDSIEGITHSLCSLEFEVHRPLYDWLIDAVEIHHPQQIEFSRLNVNYTITSKRKLKELIAIGAVNGWDDPRMPTLSGMRRRGYTPASIRNFIEKAGTSRREQIIDLSMLEYCVREDLNASTARVMAVLDPLKVVLTNYPEDQTEIMTAINNPGDESMGTREMPFSRELFIERGDFMEDPPKKFFRLGPGRMVRLKNGYIIQCDDFVKDEGTGEITELHCTYFPESRSGADTSGLKVKGTIHWVSCKDALDAEVRIYDRLFTDENPTGHKEIDYKEFINPDSLKVITAKVEPSLGNAEIGTQVQFMRKGYYCVDLDSTPDHLVFNLTATLRDSYAKKNK